MFEMMGLGVRFQFDNYGHSGIIQAIGDMDRFYKTAKKTGVVSRDMQQTFEQSSSIISSFATRMTLAGTAMAGSIVAGIHSATEFESKLAGLKKYMSDTSDVGISKFNASLSESAKYLGVAKDSIMEACQEYMAMGLEQDKALEMASAVTKAGKIWDVASQEAASAFKGISAAYDMNFLVQDTRDEFVDMLNYIADNTSLVGRESLNFLSAAGASLRTMTNTDMKGALGIAAAASKAEVNITHLGYGMNTMSQRYAEKGEVYFASIGMQAKDATGKLKPLDQMLGELNKKIKDGSVSQVALSQFASDFGGVYASDLLRIVNAWGEYDKAIEAINSKKYAGSAQREWETITQTFEHHANVTKVIWEDFVQATFGQILPIATKFVQGFNQIFTVFTEFLSAHPILAKTVTLLVGVVGVGLVLGAMFIFLISKLSAWTISLQTSTISGFSFSGMLGVMKMQLASIGGALRATATQFMGMAKGLLGVGMTFGLVYLTMKYDILGIRAMFEKFVSTIRNSFIESKNLMASSANAISASLHSFDNSDSFANHLTALFTRIGLAWDGLCDMWSDYELSDEMYDKLVASGMLPVVTSIMMLVYRLRETWRGFKDGFVETCGIVKNVVMAVLAPPFNFLMDNVVTPLIDLFTALMIKFGLLSNESTLLTSSTSKWYGLGRAIGAIAGVIVPITTVLMTFGKLQQYAGFLKSSFISLGKFLLSPFKLLASVAPTIISALSSGIGSIITMASSGLSVVTSVVSGIVSFLSGLFTTLGAPVILAITAIIASVVAFATRFKEQFDAIKATVGETFLGVFESVWNKIGEVIDNVWERLSFLEEPIGRVKEALNNVWNALVYAKDVVAGFFAGESGGALLDVFALIGATVMSIVVPAFNFLMQVVGSVFNFIIGIVGTVANVIFDVFVGVIAGVVDIFSGLINIVSGIVNVITGLFEGLTTGDFSKMYEGFSQIGTGICDIFIGLGEIIYGVLRGIWDTVVGIFGNIFEFVYSIVMAGVNGVIAIFQNLYNSISAIFGSIWESATSVWDYILYAVMRVVLGIYNGAYSIFSGLYDALLGIWNAIKDGAINGFNAIYNGVTSAVSNIVSNVTSSFNNLVSNAVSWGKNLINGFVDGIKSVAGRVSDAVSDVIKGAKDFIGFNSPSKKGEGRHIVEWGANMIGGFIDGIDSAIPSLQDKMSEVIKAPELSPKIDIIGDVSNIDKLNIGGFINDKKTSEGIADAVGAVIDEKKEKKSSGFLGGILSGIGDIVPALENIIPKAELPSLDFATAVPAIAGVGGGFFGGNEVPVVPDIDYDKLNKRNIDNIYNNRSEVNNNSISNNTNNGGGVSLTFNEGAFTFSFGGGKSDGIMSNMPEIKDCIEKTVLDLVKKLKNQQYEM